MSEGLFDPATATVDQVNDYLARADEDEQKRVLEAERNGKNRATVVVPKAAAPAKPETPCETCFPNGLGEYTAVGCEHTSA